MPLFLSVFQPHRFSRTKALYKDFIKVLKIIDVLFICDIYPAGEKPIKNINSIKLVKDLRSKKSNIFYLNKGVNIYKTLASYYDEKNIIIFMGAGSITNEAHKIIETNVSKNT